MTMTAAVNSGRPCRNARPPNHVIAFRFCQKFGHCPICLGQFEKLSGALRIQRHSGVRTRVVTVAAGCSGGSPPTDLVPRDVPPCLPLNKRVKGGGASGRGSLSAVGAREHARAAPLLATSEDVAFSRRVKNKSRPPSRGCSAGQSMTMGHDKPFEYGRAGARERRYHR